MFICRKEHPCIWYQQLDMSSGSSLFALSQPSNLVMPTKEDMRGVCVCVLCLGVMRERQHTMSLRSILEGLAVLCPSVHNLLVGDETQWFLFTVY